MLNTKKVWSVLPYLLQTDLKYLESLRVVRIALYIFYYLCFFLFETLSQPRRSQWTENNQKTVKISSLIFRALKYTNRTTVHTHSTNPTHSSKLRKKTQTNQNSSYLQGDTSKLIIISLRFLGNVKGSPLIKVYFSPKKVTMQTERPRWTDLNDLQWPPKAKYLTMRLRPQ